MSSRNPFRAPVATPIPTGASVISSVPPSYTTEPPPSFSGGPPGYSDDEDEESPEALPELTPRIPSGRPSQFITQNQNTARAPPSLPPRPGSVSPAPPLPSNRPQTNTNDALLSTDGIPESAPPAYSVTPNVNGGELVVQQGPRRAFQRAPEPFLQLSTPQNQQQQQGQQQHLQPRQSEPPRHAPPTGTPPRPNSQLSDFAQDFYNAGATTPPPDSQQQPQQPRYAPPPGPPPPGPPPPSRPRAASISRGAGSTAPPGSDGRPTTTPTPGHPLLRNGKTLIYPETYLCPKCTFPYPNVPLAIHPHFTDPNREKAGIQATRTMTRLTHVASVGIVLASHSRPLSPRAHGVTRVAGQRPRASVAAHSSARCPHSSLRKRNLNS